MRPSRVLAAAVALGVLTGCGSQPDAQDLSARSAAWSGSAQAALTCSAGPGPSGAGNYDTGPEVPGDDADAALESFLDAEADLLGLPTEGYAVVREDADRTLLAAEVDGRPVVAVVLEDGISGQGLTGWGVTSWAACDLADLPGEVHGVDVWTEADGTPVPTSRVQSAPGPEHCDWQDVTFLQVGPRTYVRDPAGKLADVTDGRFEADTSLPARARDTGWQHDGRRLWLTPRAAYVVDGAGTVERWPAAGAGCA